MRRITVYLRSNVLGLIAIFIALGAGAYASGLPRDSVKSKQIKAGAVKTDELADNAVSSPKVSNGTLLGKDFAAGQLPKGPRWAVVDSDGTLVRGSGVVSAARLFAPDVLGAYQVDFKRDVTNCALIATLGRTDSLSLNPDAGEIGAAYRNGLETGVFVKTRDSSGAEANRSFHLAVLC